MPKNQPDHDITMTEVLTQTVLEYNSRMQLVKYLGLSKSLEIAALILGPAANPGEKSDVILLPYQKLAETIDRWLMQSQGKVSAEAKQLEEILGSKRK